MLKAEILIMKIILNRNYVAFAFEYLYFQLCLILLRLFIKTSTDATRTNLK